MEARKSLITIVGCGPGSPDLLTPQALRAIGKAEILVGARRLLDLFPELPSEKIAVGADVDLILEEVDRRRKQGRIAVLVTGDPGLSSLARPVLSRFGRDACEVIPGVSSVQVAFARLGLEWLGARIIDAHGWEPEITGSQLAGEKKIALLAGRVQWVRRVIRETHDAGGGHRIYICENLTLPGEKVWQANREDLERLDFSPRTVVVMVKEESRS